MSAAGFILAMKHQIHNTLSATAAIAAALALSSTPLAAQSTDAPVTAAPTVQFPPAQPAPTMASPAPSIAIPGITATPAQPATETSAPAATGASDTVAPATTSTHKTVTRTKTIAHTAPVSAVAAPVAVAPAPANDVAPLPAETIETTTTAIAPPDAPAAEPTPTQTNNVVGTLGTVLLGLLALAILAAGLLFFRRRNPVMTETVEDPLLTRPVADEPVDEAPFVEPVVATPMSAPTMLRRRDANSVAGALPSDGAAVDLPAKAPEDYEERSALLERMVNARPDRANPFTERKARLHRARLIMQSLGTTFDREPRIDLSQYPNNWPELQRPRYKAA